MDLSSMASTCGVLKTSGLQEALHPPQGKAFGYRIVSCHGQ